VESGNWYLPDPQLAPWVDGFINECAAFPAGCYEGFERLSGVLARRRDGAPLVVLLADGHVDAKSPTIAISQYFKT